MHYKEGLRQECLRLRQEERKSLREIQELTGASKGSLSAWLKLYPLTPEEKAQLLSRRKRYLPPRKDHGEESKFHRMVQGRLLDGNQRARVAEAAVLFRLALHGFYCFNAVFDGDKVDWLVRMPSTGRVWKVQVKLANQPKEGLPVVSLRCSQSREKYLDSDVDFLVGYDIYTDTAYVWAWKELAHLKCGVSITVDAAERWNKLEGSE